MKILKSRPLHLAYDFLEGRESLNGFGEKPVGDPVPCQESAHERKIESKVGRVERPPHKRGRPGEAEKAHPPSGCQDPMDLGEKAVPVFHAPKREARDHHVEGLVFKGKIVNVGLKKPAGRRKLGLGAAEHLA